MPAAPASDTGRPLLDRRPAVPGLSAITVVIRSAIVSSSSSSFSSTAKPSSSVHVSVTAVACSEELQRAFCQKTRVRPLPWAVTWTSRSGTPSHAPETCPARLS
jgi:hypothetical protein